jgi:acetyl-CoA carboxylase biotin carboxyl carrier protein
MAKDMKGKGSADQELVRELAALLEETGLSEIEIEREGMRVRVVRQLVDAAPMATLAAIGRPAGRQAGPVQVANGDPAQRVTPADLARHPGCVNSPMVGTAYLSPDPDAPPFVKVGMRVEQGQTILIIEAMKTMNHIPAPRAGIVKSIMVENKQPVEFGEALAIIE